MKRAKRGKRSGEGVIVSPDGRRSDAEFHAAILGDDRTPEAELVGLVKRAKARGIPAKDAERIFRRPL